MNYYIDEQSYLAIHYFDHHSNQLFCLTVMIHKYTEKEFLQVAINTPKLLYFFIQNLEFAGP